jgi:5-methyltetrahydropteroyltriglutamate--homocysteine methyltransferase
MFHAEHIGSLLRPEALLRAKEAHKAGRLDADELRAVEDAAIRDIVALQERCGLPVVTDGELRRDTYVDFAMSGVTGVKPQWVDDAGVRYRNNRGEETDAPRAIPTVNGKIRNASTEAKDFAFLRSVTKATPKITVVGPCFLHFTAGREHISREVYPSLTDFWTDIVAAYHDHLRNLYAAGCRYVQMDETSIAKFPDPKIRSWLAARGDDWRDLLATYTDVINAVTDGAPKGMQVSLHLCRGNNRGHWQAEGGYDSIAESLFAKLRIDRFFLEYDTPRAGSFEPLRRLPAHKSVVLGLLSTKVPAAEPVETLIARLTEASSYVDVERLGVSPQCGFWGGINLCTFEELESKLRRVVETANKFWH